MMNEEIPTGAPLERFCILPSSFSCCTGTLIWKYRASFPGEPLGLRLPPASELQPVSQPFDEGLLVSSGDRADPLDDQSFFHR